MQHQEDWRDNKAFGPLRQILEEEWDRKHTRYTQALAPSIDDAGDLDATASRCLKYGSCLCAGVGLLGHMLHMNLARRVKARAITRRAPNEQNKNTKAPKTPARVFLEESQLCLRFRAEATVEQLAEAAHQLHQFPGNAL